jgi:AraC-like DNA-binding protein
MRQQDIHLAEQVKDFVDKNIEKEIRVKDLCTNFGINRNKLQNFVKRLFGQTIHSYIIIQKMERAATKLRTTDTSIKTIAVELGYKPSNFNRKFKKVFGWSPNSFRKQATSK